MFKGWARMAIPLQAFNVVEVRKPNVGQNKPASVTADILIDTKRECTTLHLACSFCALRPFGLYWTLPATHCMLHKPLMRMYLSVGMLWWGLLFTGVISSAGLRGDVRSEWDETKQHDVVFLLTVQPPDQVALGAMRDRGEEPTPAQQHGLIYVRGAEVVEVGQGAQHHRQHCKRRENHSESHSHASGFAQYSARARSRVTSTRSSKDCSLLAGEG